MIEATLAPVRDRAGLAAAWQDLQARADHSFFLSWSWVGTWLAGLPAATEPLCVTARAGGAVIGLGLFVPRRVVRHGVIRARTLHLHETGCPDDDQLTVEYNGLLVDRRAPHEIAAACLAALAPRTDLWDELWLGALAPGWPDWAGAAGPAPWPWKTSPCRWVDLTALGTSDYLDTLSANTRQQVRRAARLYGEVSVEAAATPAAADDIWRELVDLHQAGWQGRGAPGAFANPRFVAFHRRLIAERLPAGEIQLLRVRGGGATIGCLYNFVHEGRVLSYQSGFAFAADNRLKPGLVSHAAAIAHNRAAGHHVYDFLCGDAQYKRSLAHGRTDLAWVLVQRPRLAFALEHALRRARALVRR